MAANLCLSAFYICSHLNLQSINTVLGLLFDFATEFLSIFYCNYMFQFYISTHYLLPPDDRLEPPPPPPLDERLLLLLELLDERLLLGALYEGLLDELLDERVLVLLDELLGAVYELRVLDGVLDDVVVLLRDDTVDDELLFRLDELLAVDRDVPSLYDCRLVLGRV
jgi:hypothetical protein